MNDPLFYLAETNAYFDFSTLNHASTNITSPLINPSLAEIAAHPTIIASPSRPNFKGSIDDWFKQYGLERNVVVSAPCFSIVPLYLEKTDSIAFLPSRAVEELNVTQIVMDEMPKPFDVIAAWHPRYNDDALQKWVVSILEQKYAQEGLGSR